MQLTPGTALAQTLRQAFARAIDHLAPPPPWAVAVSGGPDSTALMHLSASYCRDHGLPAPLVLTVDHALRLESRLEAQAAASAAADLGLSHQTHSWTGPKPARGIQQAARLMRYRLLAAACERAGIESLLTGHTRDDQIETVQMRLARGSGDIGLAGMPSQARLPGTRLGLVRPLIATPKSDLLNWLDGQSMSYLIDPSNTDVRFDRARLRGFPSPLRPTDAEILAAQQRRMAVELGIRHRLAASMDRCDDRIVIPAAALTDADHAMADLMLAVLLRATGGQAHPGTRAERDRVLAALRSPTPFRGRTLAGVIIRPATRAQAAQPAGVLSFRPEKAANTGSVDIWLPFAQYPQIGFDGGLLGKSTIFTVR